MIKFVDVEARLVRLCSSAERNQKLLTECVNTFAKK